MNWIDSSEDAVAEARRQGHELAVVTLDEWRSMTAEERHEAKARNGTCVSGVRYRSAAHPWCVVARASLDDGPERWRVWDLRSPKPMPMSVASGIPGRDLALAIGTLYSRHRAVRRVAAVAMAVRAGVAALRAARAAERSPSA